MTGPDAPSRLELASERHRHRSHAVRALTVVGGGLAGVGGALLLVPLPELGLPLLLFGLRLLALEYDWAARLYAPVARLWDRLKALPRTAKLALTVGTVGVVVALVLWLG